MKMKNKLILIFAAMFFSSHLYIFAEDSLQNSIEESDITLEEDISVEKVSAWKNFVSKSDWILAFSPTFVFNPEKNNNSTPSPVVYPFSVGFVFPNNGLVSFQPRLSFFTGYYLWYDSNAYPAEIENRTATAFSFLMDFPAVFTFNPFQKHFIELGLGPSLLARFAILSNGIASGDIGASGTAADDVIEINKWFWAKGNFLAFQTYASYLFKFNEKIMAGPEARFYIPLGSVFTGRGMNGGMFSVGIKVRF